MTDESLAAATVVDRYLILMRHAKSDWDDDSLSDHDRPLNPRGKHDAPRMGQWLDEVDLVPDMILSSSSARTRETVDLMSEPWTSKPKLCFLESLYLSTPETILNVIGTQGDEALRLMVLAHNPGMTRLVTGLSGQTVSMPTAAIAIFRLGPGRWGDLNADTMMHLVHYMRPKAL